MSFKTIFTAIGIDHSGNDIEAAATLAESAKAHLSAVTLACVPPPPFGDMTGEAYTAWSQIWEDEGKRLDSRVSEFRQRLSDKGFSDDVQSVYCIRGDVAEKIGERACYADLCLVAGDMLKDDVLLKRVLDGALFQSPSPVLLAPSAKRVTLTPKTVVVAWNAGMEAGRALRQSLGMLAAANDVRIVIIDPQATTYSMGQEPGADVAAYLARHGVKVTVDVLASGGTEIDVVLRKHARDLNAELIVMGAYGHSRMRERIFGGTTQSMIEKVETPVLLSR
jgi:nucleotide-binding universal stress UspA family protein